MALKPCNECQTEISRRAKKCPHCGISKPFQSKLERGVNDLANGLLGLVFGVPLLIVLVLFLWGYVFG